MRKPCEKACLIISRILSAILVFVAVFEAGAVTRAQTSGGFSVRAVIPDNQIDVKQTYFDLRMKPGDEQTIEVVVTNSRTEELTAELRLNAASTGRNGLIVYTGQDVRDEAMKISITDVASLQSQKITVPANGSQSAKINIKMPDEPFDGMLLGGISVNSDDSGKDAGTAQGVSLNNTITYVIALKITETDNEVKPDFDLAAITPTLINYRTAVVSTLQNKAARIAKNMEIKAQVFRKNSDAVLHELSLDAAEMAPLSKGDFVIDWDNQPLNQGVYRLKMTAGYAGETWEWDREFEISGEASDLNKEAVVLMRDYTWLYILAAIAALALVWIIAYRTGKRRKKES